MDNSLVGEMIMAPVPFLRAKDFFLIMYVYFSVSDPDPDPHVLPGPHPDPQKKMRIRIRIRANIFLKVVQNHLKREKNSKNISIFSFTGTDPDPQKNADPKY